MPSIETILIYAGIALCAVSVIAMLAGQLLLAAKKNLIKKQLELDYGKRPETK